MVKEFKIVLGFLLNSKSFISKSSPSSITVLHSMQTNIPTAATGLCDFDCNILHKDLINDKDQLLCDAAARGIYFYIVPGSTLIESEAILDLTYLSYTQDNKNENNTDSIIKNENCSNNDNDRKKNSIKLLGTAGVHPYNAQTDLYNEASLFLLSNLVESNHCYAVGECGLDYSTGFPVKEFQLQWFRLVLHFIP